MKEYEDKLVELNERETFQSYMTIEEDQKVNYNTEIMLARNKGIEEGKLEGIEIGKLEGIEVGKLEGIEVGKLEGIEIGKLEGIEEGKLEGIEEGQKRSIISLYNKKYNAEQISNLLDYDLDFVEKVIKEKLN